MEKVDNEIEVIESKIAAAESNGDITRRNILESLLLELQKEKNLLLQQPAVVERVVAKVKMYFQEQIHEALITFASTQRPLEKAKEEFRLLPWFKRGTNLDAYELVNSQNVSVTDFDSIKGQPFLILRGPERIIPLSGNEWTKIQLDQLKVVFEDLPDVGSFFNGADLRRLETSQRGSELLSVLSEMDDTLFRKYTPAEEGVNGRGFSANEIRANKMLQHPICKALSAARRYATHEFFDDFVKHLLHEMGFNAGMLYVAPQMRIKLSFGSVEKVATADVTVIDMLTSARIVLVEDRYWDETKKDTDSTPQQVAEAIAVAQRNGSLAGFKRDASGSLKNTSSSISQSNLNAVYGIRVRGSMFHFYVINVSTEILDALENQTCATSNTTMYRYKSEMGLDFMLKEDRNEIILMLSLLQEVALSTGELTPRRSLRVGPGHG
eukprot:CAMPEP_0170073738 /NCGR_PEP_ID=MMETSP0019_2-20121128/11129_1 /TAXON_ID=98059 /ORGANISM="Dinobryon sp., Strain UTEXLB2267" /LENGTH=437 /DNA_ID=CAMNT_0010283515 /DNA_START=55 /DNA_END=1368 /DNA_ORIENTATION=-